MATEGKEAKYDELSSYFRERARNKKKHIPFDRYGL